MTSPAHLLRSARACVGALLGTPSASLTVPEQRFRRSLAYLQRFPLDALGRPAPPSVYRDSVAAA